MNGTNDDIVKELEAQGLTTLAYGAEEPPPLHVNVSRTGTTMHALDHPAFMPLVREVQRAASYVSKRFGVGAAQYLSRKACKRLGLFDKYVPLTKQYTQETQ